MDSEKHSGSGQTKQKSVSRREARRAALEVIFSALTGDTAAMDCLAGVRAMLNAPRQAAALDDILTQKIISAFDEQRAEIETRISEHYQRPLTNMTMMERALITAAVAEMRACPDTPVKVIINEAVELAKTFGAEGGTTLVNAVLDAIVASPPS